MDRNIQNIYVGPDFLAQGELTDGYLFLHCDVLEHNIKTLRKIRRMIQEFKVIVQQLYGYEHPLFAYTQNGRWCKLVGGTYVASLEADGQEYEVWEWQ